MWCSANEKQLAKINWFIVAWFELQNFALIILRYLFFVRGCIVSLLAPQPLPYLYNLACLLQLGTSITSSSTLSLSLTWFRHSALAAWFTSIHTV